MAMFCCCCLCIFYRTHISRTFVCSLQLFASISNAICGYVEGKCYVFIFENMRIYAIKRCGEKKISYVIKNVRVDIRPYNVFFAVSVPFKWIFLTATHVNFRILKHEHLQNKMRLKNSHFSELS